MTLFTIQDKDVDNIDTFFQESMSEYMSAAQFEHVKSMLLGGVETILISCPFRDDQKEFPIYNLSKNSRSGSKGMVEIRENGSVRSYGDSLVLTGNSVGLKL